LIIALSPCSLNDDALGGLDLGIASLSRGELSSSPFGCGRDASNSPDWWMHNDLKRLLQPFIFQWPTFYSSLSPGHKQRGRSVPEHSERWPSQTDKSIAISWQSGHPKKATESSIPARLNPPENEWH